MASRSAAVNTLVNHCIPRVDVLNNAMAKLVADDGIGVLMTGMGNDGALGLRHMLNAGATTMVQDETSCVVFGMPRAAIELGAAQRVLDLHDIAGALISEASGVTV